KIDYSKSINNKDLFEKNLNEILKNSTNDLELIAFEIHSILKEILIDLQSFSNILARMTGSGSTMFAIFDKSDENLNKCYHFLKEKYPNYFIKIDNLQN
ncbi:MAG: hypothetical protein ACKO46_05360, partial [Alphaproteobacteria bacterium]